VKVTEHNLTDWNLTKQEIQDLIRLIKLEIKSYEHDSTTQTYYGIILGKLVIMRQSVDE
jgi:hypothetical protein